jgi:toxin FitB
LRFLIDTNVLSEVTRPKCDIRVLDWLDSVDEDSTFVSVITIAELRQGVAKLAEGKKRRALDAWLRTELLDRFHGRLIDVTLTIANRWGELSGAAISKGKRMPVMDGFIAATAHVHDLIVVTRNTRHFDTLGVRCLDPWNL